MTKEDEIAVLAATLMEAGKNHGLDIFMNALTRVVATGITVTAEATRFDKESLVKLFVDNLREALELMKATEH